MNERRSEDLELSDDEMSGPPPPPRSNYQTALEAPIGQPVLNSSNEVSRDEEMMKRSRDEEMMKRSRHVSSVVATCHRLFATCHSPRVLRHVSSGDRLEVGAGH